MSHARNQSRYLFGRKNLKVNATHLGPRKVHELRGIAPIDSETLEYR